MFLYFLSWRRIQACGCKRNGFDSLSRKWNILYFYFLALATRQSAALKSATYHAMLSSGGKWGGNGLIGFDCLARFTAPTLLCAGYSVIDFVFVLIFYLLFNVFKVYFFLFLSFHTIIVATGNLYTYSPRASTHRSANLAMLYKSHSLPCLLQYWTIKWC